MKRYIFVDFDGVLNTERYHAELMKAGAKCSDQYGPLFDPEAVNNLGRIVESTGAEIVICSSWKMEGTRKMRNLWKDRNLPGTLLGCTPTSNVGMELLDIDLEDFDAFAQLAGKGNEVKRWLCENAPLKKSEYRYVILDDVPDFLSEQKRNYIEVCPKVGISADDVTKAVQILLED